jgi:hypothetical protein
VTVEELALLANGLADGSLVVAVDAEQIAASHIKSRVHIWDNAPERTPARVVSVTRQEADILLAVGAKWIGPDHLDPKRTAR